MAGGRLPTKATRPFLIAAEDPKNKGIFWAIPLTSHVQKYKERQEREGARDKYRFGTGLGRETCFNVSRMIPVCADDVTLLLSKNQNNKLCKLDKEQSVPLKKHVLSIASKPRMWDVIMPGIQIHKLYNAALQKLQKQREKEKTIDRKNARSI